MTSRALTSFALLCCLLTLACGKDEPAPAPSAAPPTPAAAPTPTAAPPAPTAAADQGPAFEGEVELRMSSVKAGKKPPTLVSLQVKGKKLRFALPEGMEGNAPKLGAKGYVVIDGVEKKVLAVSDEKRQVMVLPLAKLGEQLAPKVAEPAAPDAKPAGKAPELSKTGKSDTVAGRECDEWEVALEDKTKLRVCVAGEATSWLELPTLGLPSEHGWARELFDGKHLPVRAITFDASGNEKGRVELVKLEPKALDDALFTPPEGYKVMDLGEMMKGVASMMGGMPPPGAGGPQGMMPPGMAGKMPPNFQAVMARMREQMQAMKAQQGAPQGPHATTGVRAERTERLADPTAAVAVKAAAKSKAKTSKPAAPAPKD